MEPILRCVLLSGYFYLCKAHKFILGAFSVTSLESWNVSFFFIFRPKLTFLYLLTSGNCAKNSKMLVCQRFWTNCCLFFHLVWKLLLTKQTFSTNKFLKAYLNSIFNKKTNVGVKSTENMINQPKMWHFSNLINHQKLQS